MSLEVVMATLDRILKRPLLLAFALVLAVPLGYANAADGRFVQREDNRQNYPQRQPQQQPVFQREMPQQYPRRYENDGGEPQRSQRMSPDERRQLRRDVHDAGRDLYEPRR
jgi:hypothetical protein